MARKAATATSPLRRNRLVRLTRRTYLRLLEGSGRVQRRPILVVLERLLAHRALALSRGASAWRKGGAPRQPALLPTGQRSRELLVSPRRSRDRAMKPA